MRAQPVRMACFLLTLFLVGCGGKGDLDLKPVKGKVTIGNTPVTSGHVTFHPVDDKQPAAGMSTGKIGSDGTYTLTSDGEEGAPEGEYKVTVSPSMIPTSDGGMAPPPFNARYTDVSQTPLKVKVVEGAAAGAYDLKLSK